MSNANPTSRRGMERLHIGVQGESLFTDALPLGWIRQTPSLDFGKDGLVVIRDASELHNIEFSVQIKTSAKPCIRDGQVLLSGVSRSSVQYWFASPLPTLVVAVDLSTRAMWYGWHLDLFNSPKQVFGTSARTVTIRIPQKNQLDEAGWKAIRTDLLDHFRALQRAITSDAMAPYFMATLNNIARITGNLIRLARMAPPEPPLTKDEGMELLLEQIELRDLIETVRAFLQRLSQTSDAYKQIEFWLKSFEETALSAHPSIPKLPPTGHDIPGDCEFAYAPKRIPEVRPRLVLAAVDLLRLLTSPSPNSDSKAQAD